MLSKLDFDEVVQRLDARRRMVYETGIALLWTLTLIICLGIVTGLSTLIAHQIARSDLSTEALIGAVLMPTIFAFVAVSSAVRRDIWSTASINDTLRRALRDGIRLGMIVGFVVVAVWHYLGQLALARTVYGAFEFQSHPEMYCSPLAALYGVLFAVPVALGCALFTAVYKVGPQVWLNWVNRSAP